MDDRTRDTTGRRGWLVAMAVVVAAIVLLTIIGVMAVGRGDGDHDMPGMDMGPTGSG